MSTRRAESDLLLCCARSIVTAEHGRRMRALAERGLDWDLVVTLAGRHNLVSLLSRSLGRFCADIVPAKILAQLAKDANATAAHNLFATNELQRIMAALAAAEIPATAFKGPVLACLAYGNTSLRRFDDLDILIDRSRILDARDAFASLGYRPPPRVAKSRHLMRLRSEYCIPFRGPGASPLLVDLHCEIAPWFFSFPLDTTALLERAVQIALPGGAVWTLSREDLLLVLCMHGTKHVWPALESVASIAELLRATPELRWGEVLSRARRTGSERMLLLGCSLARNLFDAPLPEGVERALRRDVAVAALTAVVESRLLDPHDRHDTFVGMPWFHMRCRERLRDRLRYCVRGVFAPELDDALSVALPRVLFPLYWLVHPARVLALYGKAVARRW
ncbi:MAG TPA: nucleotidyltransferase family protein [Candidatus Elarobacter sp.]|nr:nucleotidyltransferase family protein [Candidatus Elarobacter sp.]